MNTQIMDKFQEEMEEFWKNLDSMEFSEEEIRLAKLIIEMYPDNCLKTQILVYNKTIKKKF